MAEIIAKKSREMLMKHMGMEDDFAELVKKVKECKDSGKFQPALDYVIDTMAAKPQYGNSLAMIRNHPADLISTETDIKGADYRRIMADFTAVANQFATFAGAVPANDPRWRTMCNRLEDFMDRAKSEYVDLEQTALNYVGGVLALTDVAEGFKEKYNTPLDRAGADGKVASTRLFKLKRAAKTIVNDAKNLRVLISCLYASQYTQACAKAGIAPGDLDIPRPSDGAIKVKVDGEFVLDAIPDALGEYDG